MGRLSIAFSVLMLLCGAASGAPTWLLASDSPRAVPGMPLEVSVIVPPGEEAPPALNAVLTAEGRRQPVLLLRLAAVAGTAGQRYQVKVPADLSGLVTLSLDGRPSSQLLLAVEPASAVAQAVAAPQPAAATAGPSAAPAVAAVPTPSLQPHDPMYLVAGRSGGDATARFQLSFKYRLFDPDGLAANFIPGVERLYFGYTQTALWDWSRDSRPFRDTTYNPSLFYDWIGAAANGMRVGVRGGYEHASNGKDAASSRSIDILFVRPSARFDLGEGNFVEVAPRVWTYLDREDNPDIARYRGFADLSLRAGDDRGVVGTLLLRRGTDGKGAGQLDLSYRLKRSLFSDVGGFFHIQYFTGYGESLLDYDQRRHPQLRFGFSVVR